jgi:transposase
MASRVDMFRRRAAECVEQAQLAATDSAKQTFLELARHWTELADRVEAMDREIHSRHGDT